jgi:hypothetical protein
LKIFLGLFSGTHRMWCCVSSIFFFFLVDWFDEAPPTTTMTKANANHPADPYPRFAVSKIKKQKDVVGGTNILFYFF